MLSINIKGDRIFFSDVKQENLETILEWYNKTSKYRFATGNEKVISMDELSHKYKDFLESPNIFFGYIQKLDINEPIGILKGYTLSQDSDSIWINILMILDIYQKKGYGTESIDLLFRKLRTHNHFKNVYLSCSSKNLPGLEFWRKLGFDHIHTMVNIPIIEKKLKDIIILGRKIL